MEERGSVSGSVFMPEVGRFPIRLGIQTLPHIDFNRDCDGSTIISTLNIYQHCFASPSSEVFNRKNNKKKIETLIRRY